jgi:hypothetical protein
MRSHAPPERPSENERVMNGKLPLCTLVMPNNDTSGKRVGLEQE